MDESPAAREARGTWASAVEEAKTKAMDIGEEVTAGAALFELIRPKLYMTVLLWLLHAIFTSLIPICIVEVDGAPAPETLKRIEALPLVTQAKALAF